MLVETFDELYIELIYGSYETSTRRLLDKVNATVRDYIPFEGVKVK